MKLVSEAISQVQTQPGKFVRYFLTLTLTLAGVAWGLIEYVFPEPLAYLYNVFRPEYVIVLFCALIFLVCTGLLVGSYLKSRMLFFIVSPIIYIVSSFAFFLIGMEFNSPDFSEGLPKVTAQNGSIFHRGIEFDHQSCRRDADMISCNLVVKNRRGQRNVKTREWRLVMKNGAVYNDSKVFRGGQELGRYGNGLDLPQGVEAQLEIVFYNVPLHFDNILKFGFHTSGDELGFKNIRIL